MFDAEILDYFQSVVSKAKKNNKGSAEAKTATDEFDNFVNAVLNGSECENAAPSTNITEAGQELIVNNTDCTIGVSGSSKSKKNTKSSKDAMTIKKQVTKKKKKVVDSESEEDNTDILSADEEVDIKVEVKRPNSRSVTTARTIR